MEYHLAVFNIGRMVAALDSPRMQPFMDGLDRINALAEGAPGFVWRYTAEGTNNATAARPYEDDDEIIINFGVWESREDLWAFVYRSDHPRLLAPPPRLVPAHEPAQPGAVVGARWLHPVDGRGARAAGAAVAEGPEPGGVHLPRAL